MRFRKIRIENKKFEKKNHMKTKHNYSSTLVEAFAFEANINIYVCEFFFSLAIGICVSAQDLVKTIFHSKPTNVLQLWYWCSYRGLLLAPDCGEY